LFPVFSSEALGVVPYLKEPLFTALYELPEIEHHKLTLLTERIMHKFYQNQVRPNLVESLKYNLKGRNLLLPLIDESLFHILIIIIAQIWVKRGIHILRFIDDDLSL
jgi:hypothetical protein